MNLRRDILVHMKKIQSSESFNFWPLKNKVQHNNLALARRLSAASCNCNIDSSEEDEDEFNKFKKIQVIQNCFAVVAPGRFTTTTTYARLSDDESTAVAVSYNLTSPSRPFLWVIKDKKVVKVQSAAVVASASSRSMSQVEVAEMIGAGGDCDSGGAGATGATATSHQKPNVVFVLGPPGSGKGTQCTNIVQEFGYVHLSAGDLLREERDKPGSKLGELIEGHIRNGTIVPVEITCTLIEQAMERHQRSGHGRNFLIDGFPRSQNNLSGWQEQMSSKVNLLFVLFFECPAEVCVERCLARGKSADPAVRRSDDNLESLQKRISTYNNDTLPIIQYFVKLDKVKCIDSNAKPEKVFEQIRGVFQDK